MLGYRRRQWGLGRPLGRRLGLGLLRGLLRRRLILRLLVLVRLLILLRLLDWHLLVLMRWLLILLRLLGRCLLILLLLRQLLVLLRRLLRRLLVRLSRLLLRVPPLQLRVSALRLLKPRPGQTPVAGRLHGVLLALLVQRRTAGGLVRQRVGVAVRGLLGPHLGTLCQVLHRHTQRRGNSVRQAGVARTREAISSHYA